MSTFFIYILKWALCLALLYIPFALLLRKETFATFNRWLLIGLIAVSGILPAVTITFPVEVEIVRAITTAGDTITGGELPAYVNATDTVAAPVEEGFDWKSLLTVEALSVVYLIGLAIALILRAVEIARIIIGIKRGTTVCGKHNGMTLHCHTGETAPFSWFGHVVMSQSDYEECGSEIMLHEEGHCRNGHSWDMLMLGIVKSLQWFNPFAYMLANDMKEIHEYEADRHVLKHHGNTRAYQLLLLRKAVGETAFNLANNFNQSSVRKRITMMARKPSGQMRKGKALAMAPMALLFIFIFAEPEYIYCISRQSTQPAEEQSATEDAYSVAGPLIETTPLPLRILPAKEQASPERIEPIKAPPLSAEATRLAEKFEEHATETYYEYVDINGSEVGATLAGMNVKRCSVKVQFVADRNGNAHSINVKGINVSAAGDAAGSIGRCKRFATEAATRHILAKEWPTAIKSGKNISTIYEAHIILNFGKKASDNNSGHTMMAGSTPIN